VCGGEGGTGLRELRLGTVPLVRVRSFYVTTLSLGTDGLDSYCARHSDLLQPCHPSRRP
jgi:hypothetical protein